MICGFSVRVASFPLKAEALLIIHVQCAPWARAVPLNQVTCLPSTGMLQGSPWCHSLQCILREERVRSKIYDIYSKVKLWRLYWQYDTKGKIQRFFSSDFLFGIWVGLSRGLTPFNSCIWGASVFSENPRKRITFTAFEGLWL